MSHRSTIPATVAVIASLAPAGAFAGQDWRSPDARDAGQPKVVIQDLRSPDARDVADHRPVVAARVIDVSSGGFDWGDAAIGAGGTVGIVLVLAGAGLTVTRRRATRTVTP
jgi:hypothetical protein